MTGEIMVENCDRCGNFTDVRVLGDKLLCDGCRQTAEREHDKRERRNARARRNRAALKDAMDSIGVKRVRGALGGVFWE